MENDFKDTRGSSGGFTRIETINGCPGEVTVEHIEGGWAGENGGERCDCDPEIKISKVD